MLLMLSCSFYLEKHFPKNEDITKIEVHVLEGNYNVSQQIMAFVQMLQLMMG